MAGKVRVEMNSAGAQELLKSPEVQGELRKRADRVAAAAGEGHEVSVWVGRDRARATVTTVSARAKRAEANDRALLRALEAGGGE